MPGIVMSETQKRSARKLGLFTLCAFVAALAAAIPLHCLPTALRVGSGSLLLGTGLGGALAFVTRTRRPLLIYMGLLLAALTFVPLAQNWPPGDAWDIHPWHGAPQLAYSYLDILRTLLYLVGIPWPFARFGHHAPDPLPMAAIPQELPEESEKL